MKGKIVPGGVDEYIDSCPKEVRSQLKVVRKAIMAVAPGAIETTSYFNWPGYSYPGYDYNGMFAWFSYKKPYVRLHLRPPVIQNHKKELSAYATTKAVVSFIDNSKLPVSLIKKLVIDSQEEMKGNSK